MPSHGRGRVAYSPTIVVLTLLAGPFLAAGCPPENAAPPPPGGTGAPKVPEGAPIVDVKTAERVALGETAQATVEVANPTDRPMVLVSVSLKAGAESVASLSPGRELPAERAPDGTLALDGTLEVEDIGPQARMPEPPRWSWKGAEAIVPVPLLAPGGRLDLSGSFKATDATGGKLEATVLYAGLGAGAPLFRVSEARIEPPAGAGSGEGAARGFGRGFVPAARARAALVPTTTAAPAGAEPVAFAPAEGFFVPAAELPRLFPDALPATAFASLAIKGTQVARAFVIERPAFDLPAAREKSGLAVEPSVYYLPGKSWVFEGPSTTVVVSADRRIEVEGRAAALFKALNDRDSVPVTLYERSAAPDPEGLAKIMSEAGLKVNVWPEKGGGESASVEVTRETLLPFLETLGREKLGLAGFRVQRTSRE